MAPADEPPLDAAELFVRLHAAGVAYVVIGGFAVIAHGVVRATRDLDVCPAPDSGNLERLATLLRNLEARQFGLGEFAENEFPLDPTRAADLAQGGNFLVLTALGRLDVMQWIPGIEAEQAYAVLASDALEAIVHGVPVRVASLPQLRAMKAAAGRPQDHRDLEDLSTAHPEPPPRLA